MRPPSGVIVAVTSPAWLHMRFRGPVLPDGEARDLYVVDGRITYEPQAGAETVAEGWIVPGPGRRALPRRARRRTARSTTRTTEAAGARRPRRRGAAAARLRLGRRHPLDPRPRRPAAADPLRAGTSPRTKRYIRNYAHEVEPADLAAYVAQEAQRGDGWVKLVGDWISRDDGRPGAVVPGRGVRRGDRGRARARRARSPRTASARRCCPG